MVLICPHCAARSMVDDAQAQKPTATVACGSCGKKYFTRAAHRDTGGARPDGGQVKTPRSTADARVRLRRWLRPAVAVVAPLALFGLCWWDLHGMGPLDADLRSEIQLPASSAEPRTLEDVTATPYAPAGGPEGLLVTGRLRYSGTAAASVPPEVVVSVRHASLGATRTLLLRACATCTLAQADSLAPLEATETTQPVLLGPKGALPFVGLIELPALPSGATAPWQLELGFSGAL